MPVQPVGATPSNGLIQICLPQWNRSGGGSLGGRTIQSGVATSAGGSLVLDVAEWMCVFAVVRVRFLRGTARYRIWCEVDHRPLDWASRSLKREFELLIMVEVQIEEMFGSD